MWFSFKNSLKTSYLYGNIYGIILYHMVKNVKRKTVVSKNWSTIPISYFPNEILHYLNCFQATLNIFAHSTFNFHLIFKCHTILESWRVDYFQGVIFFDENLWPMRNQYFKIGYPKGRNFLLPTPIKKMFSQNILFFQDIFGS